MRDLQDVCLKFIKQNPDLFEHLIPSLPQKLRDKLSPCTGAVIGPAVRDLQDVCLNFIKRNLDLFEEFVPSLPKELREKLSNDIPALYTLYYPSEYL